MNPSAVESRRSDRVGSGYFHRFINWIIAGPKPEPQDIQIALLCHSLTKRNTLIVLTLAMGLVACAAIVTTGRAWAFAWLAAELVLGAAKLSFQFAFETERASGRVGNPTASLVAGLAGGIVLGTAGFECVMSGNWLLMLLSGICLGGMVGGIGSRNAGIPRFAIVMMSLVTLPYSVATIFSPIPYLFVIGLQMPLFLGGLVLVLKEDYKILLGLYHAESENRWHANHDMLTGLPNRILQHERFVELLREPDSHATSELPLFTVFCLDLDGFKDVNDGFGHSSGDAVLIEVAGRLRECVRDVDFLSRIGGDEFVILLPAISDTEAFAVAQRIIDRVSEPFEIGAMTLRIGVSIGIASAPNDGRTASELLRSADRAMYEAKKRGKGHFAAGVTALGLAELAPEADADARMAPAAAPETGQFPLPF